MPEENEKIEREMIKERFEKLSKLFYGTRSFKTARAASTFEKLSKLFYGTRSFITARAASTFEKLSKLFYEERSFKTARAASTFFMRKENGKMRAR